MNSTRLNGQASVDGPWGPLLLAINFVGAVGYVIAASHAWVPAQERALGLHSVTGEPYVWALYVFPIWALFILLNLVCGALAVARRQRLRGIWLLTAVPVWLIALAIDFAHH